MSRRPLVDGFRAASCPPSSTQQYFDIMRAFKGTVFLAAATFAVALVTSSGAKAADYAARVLLQIDKVTAAASTEVWALDHSKLLGQSCNASLVLGEAADYLISFNVNHQDGSGNVTVGLQTYGIHEDETISGGISCSRIHSKTELAVSCYVTIPDAAVPHSTAGRAHVNCFPGRELELGPVLYNTAHLDDIDSLVTEGALDELFSSVSPAVTEELSWVDARKVAPRRCVVTREAVRVGNGNPHQNPLFIQLSVSEYFILLKYPR